MRAMIRILSASLSVAATPAAAQEHEPHYANFDVTQSAPRRAHDIATVRLGGAPVALNAYGRNARARALDAAEEARAAHRLGEAFDPATKPAFMTIEASVRF